MKQFLIVLLIVFVQVAHSQESFINIDNGQVMNKHFESIVKSFDEDPSNSLPIPEHFIGKVKMYSAYDEYGCAIDDKNLKCFNSKDIKPVSLQRAFVSPSLVSVGKYYACAVDDNGIDCWAHSKFGNDKNKIVTDAPKDLKNLKMIAIGNNIACALTDEKIICWGEQASNLVLPKNLSNPKSLVIRQESDSVVCTVDDEGVKCGHKQGDEAEIVFLKGMPKNLKNVKSISLGANSADQSCLFDDEGMKCWGFARAIAQAEFIGHLKDPKAISFGDGTSVCALEGDQVSCRSLRNKFSAVPFRVKNPRMLMAGDGYSCILGDDGIQCGKLRDNKVGPNFPLTLKKPTKFIQTENSKIACAVDEAKIKCWRLLPYDGNWYTHYNVLVVEKEIPEDLNEIVIEGYTRCFAMATKVSCQIGVGSSISDNSETFVKNADIVFKVFVQDRSVDKTITIVTNEGVKAFNNKTGGFVQVKFVLPNLENPTAFSYSNYGICLIEKGELKCERDPSEGNFKNVISYNQQKHAVFDVEGIKAMAKHYSIDQASIDFRNAQYFYKEKAIPLNYIQEILLHVDMTQTDSRSLLYFRERIVGLFLTGVNSDVGKNILNNTEFLRKFYRRMNLVNDKILAERNSMQLRFLLEVVSSSLTSSKELLTSSSKSTVDNLKLEFANVLSEDEISQEAAIQVMKLTLSSSGLMQEMSSSYRMMGIKTFYEWMNTYLVTGNI